MKEEQERQEKREALEKKEKREANEEGRRAVLLERKVEAEETANKILKNGA